MNTAYSRCVIKAMLVNCKIEFNIGDRVLINNVCEENIREGVVVGLSLYVNPNFPFILKEYDVLDDTGKREAIDYHDLSLVLERCQTSIDVP